MGGSTTINVMVYVHFVGSPKLKFQPLTLVFNWIVGSIAQEIKYKLDNISV